MDIVSSIMIMVFSYDIANSTIFGRYGRVNDIASSKHSIKAGLVV